jgi:hypothetical protein
VRETPRPGGARTGGRGPTGRVNLSASGGTATATGGTVDLSSLTATPIEPAKSLVTRPDASPAERRQWMEDQTYILAWATAGGYVGDAFLGRVAGLVCFTIALYCSAWKVRRGSRRGSHG